MMLLLLLGCGLAPAPLPVTEPAPLVTELAPPVTEPAPPSREPPAAQAASIYALPVHFVDQHGTDVGLDVANGHPVLISMFYTSCTTACPLLIGKLQAIEAALSPDVRADLRVVLVSFDPEHDTPTALATVATDHGLDARWSLLHAEADAARQVSAVLNFRYVRHPDGNFDHSTGITLLDRSGVVERQLDGLGSPAEELVAAIEGLGT